MKMGIGPSSALSDKPLIVSIGGVSMSIPMRTPRVPAMAKAPRASRPLLVTFLLALSLLSPLLLPLGGCGQPGPLYLPKVPPAPARAPASTTGTDARPAGAPSMPPLDTSAPRRGGSTGSDAPSSK